MGFSIPNPIDVVKSGAGHLADAGGAVINTTKNVVETGIDVIETGVDATKTAAVKTYQFQEAVVRFGLEKSLQGALFAGEKTVEVTKKGVELGARGVDLAQAAFDRASHPGDPNPPAAQGLTFAETKSASELAYKKHDLKAGDVYEFPDGKQWRVAEVSSNPSTGFRAIALQQLDAKGNLPSNPRTVVAFSGSDEGVDWLNNVGQGFGLPTPQYKEAADFADKWKQKEGDDVILSGHSLGGGLASYAALKTNLHATAVNSSPLALDHLGLNPFDALRITQYYVPGEALSVLNKANPLDIRPGFGIEVQGKDSILDPRSVGSNHSLDNVAPDIGKPKKIS